MTTKAIPSLSNLGWVTDIDRMLEKILSFYILTDKGQSLAYDTKIVSLPYTYRDNINNPLGMKVAIESDLRTMFNTYFQQFDLEVDTKVSETSKEATILIYAVVISEEGTRHSLGKVLAMNTTGLRKTVDINNYGDGSTLFDGGL